MPANPYKRHKTRHPGITYRLRADGSRHYNVLAQGKQHSVVGGEREALALQAELRGKAARGQKILPTKTKIDALATEWLASKTKLRETTRSDYEADLKNVILPRFGHLKPSQVTADEVAKLIRQLDAKGLSGARIKNILKPLNGVMKLAARRGLITQNPIDLLTPDERPQATNREHHTWSPEEIKRVIRAAKAVASKPFAKYDYTTLITVAIHTGLRKGELLGLRWCDIDLKGASLHVRHKLSRKGKLEEPKTPKAVRTVPLAPDMVTLLTKHKLASSYSNDTDFVFASSVGTPLNARNVVTRGFEPALKAAGLAGLKPKIVFHDLRHAFASFMIERGTSSVDLAEVMGHRDSRTTERIYIHLFNRQRMEEKVRAAMQSAMDLTSR
jgi:integrase